MKIEKKLIKTNYKVGREGYGVKAIVLHIAQGYMAGALSWFNNPSSGVSSHYMISKTGEIWQFVEESNTAFHAGTDGNLEYWGTNQDFGRLYGRINPNLITIGIENEGFTGERWTEAQIEANRWLIQDIHERYNLGEVKYPATLLGHEDINRKTRSGCPGMGIHITNDIIIPVNQRIKNKQKDNYYRVFWGDVQQGAYLELLNALDKWSENMSQKVTFQGEDITYKFIEMAKPLTQKIEELTKQVDSLHKSLEEAKKQNEKLVLQNAELTQLQEQITAQLNTQISEREKIEKENEKLIKEINKLKNPSGKFNLILFFLNLFKRK